LFTFAVEEEYTSFICNASEQCNARASVGEMLHDTM
jgi:hypothetical protein